jgi:hypothetical protein
MKSLFNKADYNEITARIHAITGNEQARWGKMNIAQMLAHCILPLEVAAGHRTVAKGFIGWLLSGVIKKAILSPKPYSHNTPTMRDYNMAGKTFDTAKEKELLLKAIDRFVESEPTAEGRKHPVVGALTKDEWGFSQYKHLDHHLAQYGL